MSSSLFYDCYAPYESYPYTEYLKGDKTFGEVGIHDVLYCLNEYNELTELEVTNPFHVTKGRCYITIKGKGKNIDFGSCNCANVLEARDKSIVHYNGCIIGTEKDSVIGVKCCQLNSEIIQAKNKYNYLTSVLDKVKSL